MYISPFKYSDSTIMVDEKAGKQVNYSSINKFLQEGIISIDDLHILRYIFDYKYINRNNLERLVAANPALAHISKNLSSRLKKYLKINLVTRCFFEKNSDERTPNFYILTLGMASFLNKRYDLKISMSSYMILEAPSIILKKLSINQLDISLKLFDDIRLERNKFLRLDAGRSKLTLDFYFNISVSDTSIDFLGFSLRRVNGWLDIASDLVNLINRNLFINRISTIPNPYFLFLFEDALQIEELYNHLTNKNIYNNNTFYLTDSSLLDNSVFSILLKVQKAEKFTIQQHKLTLN